jgi:hypothetical protein
MSCKSCQSTNQQHFPSEVSLQAPADLHSLNLPSVLVFPSLLVCLECGFVEFSIPHEILHELGNLKRTA